MRPRRSSLERNLRGELHRPRVTSLCQAGVHHRERVYVAEDAAVGFGARGLLKMPGIEGILHLHAQFSAVRSLIFVTLPRLILATEYPGNRNQLRPRLLTCPGAGWPWKSWIVCSISHVRQSGLNGSRRSGRQPNEAVSAGATGSDAASPPAAVGYADINPSLKNRPLLNADARRQHLTDQRTVAADVHAFAGRHLTL